MEAETHTEQDGWGFDVTRCFVGKVVWSILKSDSVRFWNVFELLALSQL